MNLPFAVSLLSSLVLALAFAGCKREAQPDATAPLQQSYQGAAPEVQKAVNTVTASLKAGNYAEATRVLTPLVTQRPMTPAQREAVGVALQQINQAIAANPSLNTREMYEMRAKMFQAVHSGPRF